MKVISSGYVYNDSCEVDFGGGADISVGFIPFRLSLAGAFDLATFKLKVSEHTPRSLRVRLVS